MLVPEFKSLGTPSRELVPPPHSSRSSSFVFLTSGPSTPLSELDTWHYLHTVCILYYLFMFTCRVLCQNYLSSSTPHISLCVYMCAPKCAGVCAHAHSEVWSSIYYLTNIFVTCIHYICLCMHVCMGVCTAWHTHGSQRMTCGSCLSSSTLWVLGREFTLPDQVWH